MDKGKFPLAKRVSNHEKVLRNIPPHKRIFHFVPDRTAIVKILGLLYDREIDNFALKLKRNENIKFTKRRFTSIAASVYDPLGFILPITMRNRLYVQNLWKEKYGWDDLLPENKKFEFMILYIDLEFLSELKISR